MNKRTRIVLIALGAAVLLAGLGKLASDCERKGGVLVDTGASFACVNPDAVMIGVGRR